MAWWKNGMLAFVGSVMAAVSGYSMATHGSAAEGICPALTAFACLLPLVWEASA